MNVIHLLLTTTILISANTYAHQAPEWHETVDLTTEVYQAHDSQSIGEDGCWSDVTNYGVGLYLHPTQRVTHVTAHDDARCQFKQYNNTNNYLINMDLTPDYGGCQVHIEENNGKKSSLTFTCTPG